MLSAKLSLHLMLVVFVMTTARRTRSPCVHLTRQHLRTSAFVCWTFANAKVTTLFIILAAVQVKFLRLFYFTNLLPTTKRETIYLAWVRIKYCFCFCLLNACPSCSLHANTPHHHRWIDREIHTGLFFYISSWCHFSLLCSFGNLICWMRATWMYHFNGHLVLAL